MEHINDKKSYSISYEEMITCAEDICSRFTDQYMLPIYSVTVDSDPSNKIQFNIICFAVSAVINVLFTCMAFIPLVEITKFLNLSSLSSIVSGINFHGLL